MTSLIAIVPVRGGSKGLPGKNLKLFGDVPLWERAALQGLEAGANRVVVTTDVPDLISPGDPRIEVLRRDRELALDDTPMAPVLIDALTRAIDVPAKIVLLQPTSPLRNRGDIRRCVELHDSGAFDLVLSVSETDRGVLKYGLLDGDHFTPLADPAYCFSNRQSLPPVVRPNGAVYVFDSDWFLANEGFVTNRMGAVEMPPERSFDIDTEADFDRALQLI